MIKHGASQESVDSSIGRKYRDKVSQISGDRPLGDAFFVSQGVASYV